jgi:energy-coupling factor transporter ATP-binding protein EcfA2
MSELIVVTGPPGAGKSTVAKVLAQRYDPSALISSDAFFAMVGRGYIDPWTEAAHRQNEFVVAAAAAAAGRMTQGGYTVVFDGVIGPWFLETFLAATGLREVHYVMADRAITVNAINPGPVDTGWPSDELRERLRPAFPAGRWGQPTDIAKIVSWLISPDSAWLTGQVVDAAAAFAAETRHAAASPHRRPQRACRPDFCSWPLSDPKQHPQAGCSRLTAGCRIVSGATCAAVGCGRSPGSTSASLEHGRREVARGRRLRPAAGEDRGAALGIRRHAGLGGFIAARSSRQGGSTRNYSCDSQGPHQLADRLAVEHRVDNEEPGCRSRTRSARGCYAMVISSAR